MPTKVLALNSFAVHGMASLKAATRLLGSHVLPVPTVVLNGLTNMPYVQKHFLDFDALLEGTFKLVAHNQQRVILYIGYIGNPDQVDTILRMVDRYREHIDVILTDPISGDHGKAYVPASVIQRLPELTRISNYVFPNLTELKLLTGHPADGTVKTDHLIERFKDLYPTTRLVVTSFSTRADQTGILLAREGGHFQYEHALHPKSYSGTGDAFLSYFIQSHFYALTPVEDALQYAAGKILERIEASLQLGASELIL